MVTFPILPTFIFALLNHANILLNITLPMLPPWLQTTIIAFVSVLLLLNLYELISSINDRAGFPFEADASSANFIYSSWRTYIIFTACFLGLNVITLFFAAIRKWKLFNALAVLNLLVFIILFVDAVEG